MESFDWHYKGIRFAGEEWMPVQYDAVLVISFVSCTVTSEYEQH